MPLLVSMVNEPEANEQEAHTKVQDQAAVDETGGKK